MIEKIGWTRRMVLAAKAAMAGGLSLPTAAMATVNPTASTHHSVTSAVAPARWPTATAQEMQPFVGQRFRVHTQEHGTLVLKLVDVQSPASDPARPAHLPRRVGMSAVFDGPDAQLLAGSEDTTHSVSHPKIGTIRAYLKTMPRQSGGFEIEMILN